MEVQVSDVIAFGALIIAGFALRHSQKSVTESKNANKLALQFERVKIYRHLIDYHNKFRPLFIVPTWDDVDRFKDEAVILSEIYFPSDIAGEFLAIHLVSNEYAIQLSALEGQDDQDNAEIAEIRREFKDAICEYIDKLKPKIVEQLKVSDI